MRSRGRWDRLRARLITWSFVPALLILAAAAVITFFAYEGVVQSEVVDRERERAYLSANRLKEEMAKFSDVLNSLARTEAIYEGDPVGQRTELSEARRRLSIFDGGVILLDNFGEVLGAEPGRPEIAGQDWSDRPYFRQLLSGASVVFSDAMADGPGGASVVVVAVPITSAHGEFLGTLAGMFRLGEPTISALYASLVRLRMGESLYLVDGTGQVIYHPDPDQIGEALSTDPSVAQVLAGQVGAERLSGGRGEPDVVAAFAPVPGTPWGLITEEDWSTLAGPSRRYGRFLLLLLVLGIILPAAWFGLLAHQRRSEAVERAHLEHQLQVARLIQQTLLPKDTPNLQGWRLSGHYQPAHAVGGDFYDFLPLADGRLGLIIGDVTDKGVPAALLMATTRSLLRTIAQRVHSPGQVLRQVNELLGREIPPKMFVTCLYAVLDPATGRLQYANAGHNLPYRAQPGNGGVAELRATGMPLGLMPDMHYEEKETTIRPGECVVFYSDGLVEAHDPQREMFGNPRLQRLLDDCADECPTLIQRLLEELETFTGRGWQQEDDVTLVTLQRAESQDLEPAVVTTNLEEADWRTLARFSLPSEPGAERQAIQEVVEAIQDLGLPKSRLERLKTAVGETTMNAIEHGNKYRPELWVSIHVRASEDAIMIEVSDEGSGSPAVQPPKPDLEAKIAGRQSPRGWGLFLIENMVDQMNVIQDKAHHTVELVLFRNGESDGNNPV
jgi:serine phosphatase RsbU (regulator of sigma subunit)/anti-sigma regulatory factor (Ser/Thr protein kinase)